MYDAYGNATDGRNKGTELYRNMASMNRGDWYSPAQFWHSGPAPASLYNFPGGLAAQNTHFVQRSQ